MEKLVPSFADHDQHPAVAMPGLDGDHPIEPAARGVSSIPLTSSASPSVLPVRIAEVTTLRPTTEAETRLPKLRSARRANNDAFERAYVLAALEATNQNVTRAAKLAGVSRQQIQRLMIKHCVRRGEPAPLAPAQAAASGVSS